MTINLYLDISPFTNRPFYVGIGGEERCKMLKRNKLHSALVSTFPEKKFKRVILYKNISIEKANRIEQQIIKRCGRIIDGSGILTNIHKGGSFNSNINIEFGHINRGRKIPEVSKRQEGKTMRERLNNPDWIHPFKGKTAIEIYGDGYIHPRKGKKLQDVKGEEYIEPKSKPFKLIINDTDILRFRSEREFIEKTKLTSPMLCKLKREGVIIIKKLSNSIHIFKHGDIIKFIPLTIEEFQLG